MGQIEKAEHCFRELIFSFQIAKLYGAGHRRFTQAVDKAFLGFEELFKETDKIVFGIIGDELAFQKEVFFELSKTAKPIILYLKQRGIEKIAFSSGLKKDEFFKFIVFLATSKEKLERPAQDYLSLDDIRNISVGRIGAEENISAELPSGLLNLYNGSLDDASRSIETMLDGGQVDFLGLRFSLNSISENLTGNYNELLKLVTIKRFDPVTFIHSVNVSVLAMYFSLKMGFNKDDVLDIGLAALFHDIGKLYISRKIIRKSEKLDKKELGMIQSHTVTGAKILLNYVDTLDILAVVVAFEHHMKYNLKGYPKSNFGHRPHVASLIVSICDVYDALSQKRSYKQDYSPDFVYQLMMREKGESFDPDLLERFFHIIGIWPIGTIVQLSDGRVGLVRGEDRENIHSPVVEVVSTPDKSVVDLSQNRDLKILKSLNPYTEGKEYRQFI